MRTFLYTHDEIKAALIIRVMVGAVFVSEGIQKFLYADSLGVGRFIRIGIPFPDFTAPMVGVLEIVCGTLILAGLFTRLAVIPIIIIMFTAIATTKIPIFIKEGFFPMAHASRTDWSMLLGSIFLLLTGAGKYSVDHIFSRKYKD